MTRAVIQYVRTSLPVILMGLLLSGCGVAQLALDPVIQKPPPVAIPPVAPLALNPVQWQVITSAGQPANPGATSKSANGVLFALDATNYQNLNLNLIEIKRYLSEQQAVVTLLKKIVDQESGVVTNNNVQDSTHTLAPQTP